MKYSQQAPAQQPSEAAPLTSSTREEEVLLPTPSASLDGLPTELKIIVLRKCPDVTTLRALVHSSPLYRTAYISQQQKILFDVLNTISTPNLLFEAHYVFKSLTFREDDGPVSRVSEIRAFLTDYHESRENSVFPSYSMLDLDTLISIARFQLKIEEMVRQYSLSILAKNPVSNKQESRCNAVTKTELIRLYRGLYRLELFCSLFGERKYDIELDDEWGFWARGFSALTISRLFLSKLAAWEVEEIVCMGKYIVETYHGILKEGGSPDRFDMKDEDLSEPNDRARSYPLYRKEYVDKAEYCMSRGLSLFHKTISTDSRSAKLDLIATNSSGQHSFLPRALESFHGNQQRAQRLPSMIEEHRGGVLFMGDEAGPNAGFVWSRAGKPWGIEHVDHTIRGWGYVFWDENRLRDWGLLKYTPREG